MDDLGLARVVGTGTPTTRLSAVVNDQGIAQSQWPAEDLRASLSNWFADGNVQVLANMGLRN
jgi:hypothetical protein